MTWSMPRPLLQWVAALLGLTAVTAFVMGIINAPEHGGRLPGERIPGQPAGSAAAIVAPEATPLSQERIEGPPPEPEKPATNKTEAPSDEAAAEPATNTTSGPLLNLPPATNTTPEEANAPPPSPEDEPPH